MPTELNTAVSALADLLLQRKLHVVTAESCTGGGVASAFTDLPGSSQWFECGFVTYSNAAKMLHLGVSSDIIQHFGAVSEQTVRAMVAGAVVHSDADVALAVSGVAGPGGGSEQKPVGTVWFAWGDAQQQETLCCHFHGDRQAVREQAVLEAVQGLARWLQKK